MDKQNAVVVSAKKQHFINAVKYGVATAIMLSLSIANASEIEKVSGAVTDEITGSKALMIILFTAGASILGFIAGWRYLKRGVNSV